MSETKTKKKKHVEREGPVHVDDKDLVTWLHRLWTRKVPPERIEVYQMFGRNHATRGEMVHHQDFFDKDDKHDVEACVRLCSEFHESAQNDCDSSERKMYYMIVVKDSNMGADPLTRRLGPLYPKRRYLQRVGERGQADGEDDAEEDTDLRTGKSVALAYTRGNLEEGRADKNRYDRVMGELLLLQRDIIRGQQAWVDRMFEGRMAAFTQLQDAEDRSLDREASREWTKLKVILAKDGIRFARNMVPGFFAGESGEAGVVTTKVDEKLARSYGPSLERTLVANFLADCEADGITEALFGDCKVEAGVLKLADPNKPGVFTLQQFAILVGVRDGALPPEALDDLMPDTGKSAITGKQIDAAKSYVTEGVGSAIFEIIGLRGKRRAATPAPTNDETK